MIRARQTRQTRRTRRGVGAQCAAIALAIALAPTARAATLSELGDATVDGLAVAYDLTILRPLNAVATLLGAGFFVASLPLVAPFEGIGTSWDVFVGAPFEYTFQRDLGDI